MYCKHCMRQIDDDVAFCPACGKPQKTPLRKPIYKRWWFWTLAIVLFISLTGSNDDAPSNSNGEISGSGTDVVQVGTQPDQQLVPNAPIAVEDSNVTTGEKNALRAAKNYLRILAFSYEGLIDQLEFDGYTSSEATYAAMNCGANWNEQAHLSAENYLDTMPFSREGLIEQLEFDGFTSTEATFGIDKCNANWNEQAALCAENYLDIMAFSREGLIEQLEFDGFTREQAVYGVQQNGY